MKTSLNINEQYFINLLKSVLHKTKSPSIPDGVSMDAVFHLAKEHYLETMFFAGIQSLESSIDPQMFNHWKKLMIQHYVIDILQKEELKAITDLFETSNISHIPLKGFLLKDLYPETSMRQMSDLDILIRTEDRKNVRQLMESLGYETKQFDIGGQDVYFKAPAINVEIHHRLFSKSLPVYDQYFQNTYQKILHQPSEHYQKNPGDAVSFGYVIAHLAKHYLGFGTGVRSVLDIYLFLHQKPDLAYSEEFLNILNNIQLGDFYQHLSNLAEIWFGDADATPLYEQMGAYIMQAGIYGHRKNYDMNAISKDLKTNTTFYKLKRMLEICFPSIHYMKDTYPWVRKYPFLLPLSYPFRAGEVLFTRRQKLKLLKNTKELSVEDIKQLQELHKRTGLYH